MRKFAMLVATLMFLIFAGFASEAIGQEPKDKTGAVTIPWDEFRGLLNLDENQIVIPLEIFQKLVAQTGTTTIPTYTLQGGNVILSRNDFTNLVNQMKPPISATATLPFDYLVTKAMYSGKVQDYGTTFQGTFIVHVLKRDVYLRVPILPLNVALEDVTINGIPTLVVSDNGYHSVVLSKPGEYVVTASFSLKSSFKSAPNKIDLIILPTPITLLKLELPHANLEVEIPEAQKMHVSSDGHITNVTAVLAQGYSASIRWRKKTAPSEKIPPKLYTELYHLISIEDDVLRVSTDVNLNILYSEINTVELAIPAKMNVLSVTGEGVGDWQESVRKGHHIIEVPFTYGIKGNVYLNVTLETTLTESGLTNEFPGIQVIDAVRETGYIGVELNTSAEVVVAGTEGLEPVAVQKLPPQLVNKSTKPLMLGFKNLKFPYSLVLDVKRHRKIAVPMATINSANVVTLFTEDGKVVNRLVYQVRNNAKQFLEISIPPTADIWSVFVDGKPVESSINYDGKLLVPLIRSMVSNEQLATFPVEVIYCVTKDKFTWANSRESALPSVDLLISQLMWSVYLPNNYAYHHFSSTLEIEEMISSINLLSSNDRRYNEAGMKEISRLDPSAPQVELVDKLKKVYEGKEYASTFRNIPLKDEEIVGQLNAELEFGGRMEKLADLDSPQGAVSSGSATGVLPIQIRIPTGGQVYRFAKTIIKPEDPLSFKVTYTRAWVGAAVKWILLLGFLFMLYQNRKRFVKPLRLIGKKLSMAVSFYNKRSSALNKAAGSVMAAVVLLGLAVVFWPFFRFVSVMCLFLFWISAAYQVIEYRKKIVQAKAQTSPGGTSK